MFRALQICIIVAILLPALLASLQPLGAQGQCSNSKVSGPAIEVRIESCTAAIESGKLQGRDLAQAYNNRASAYVAKQDRRALIDATEALRRSPDDASAYVTLAAALRVGGYAHYVMPVANKAIQLDPNSAKAYVFRGEAFLYKGDSNSAVEDATTAIRLDPKDASAYELRGRAYAYYNKQDYVHAIADLDEAIRLAPDFAAAFASRGLAYGGMRDRSRAIAEYSEAIRLDNDSSVYRNLRA